MGEHHFILTYSSPGFSFHNSRRVTLRPVTDRLQRPVSKRQTAFRPRNDVPRSDSELELTRHLLRLALVTFPLGSSQHASTRHSKSIFQQSTGSRVLDPRKPYPTSLTRHQTCGRPQTPRPGRRSPTSARAGWQLASSVRLTHASAGSAPRSHLCTTSPCSQTVQST